MEAETLLCHQSPTERGGGAMKVKLACGYCRKEHFLSDEVIKYPLTKYIIQRCPLCGQLTRQYIDPDYFKVKNYDPIIDL